ncbi:MAG: YheU family protein [Halioglobus sp.]
MSQILEIPIARLDAEVLEALLEEFATRDGTDYGLVETDLQNRVSQLKSRLERSEMALLYDSESEQWDLLSRERADEFLNE